MPRMFTGVRIESRVLISLAALLVKVTASTESGLACPVASSHAMRVVRTRVLPLPAPARISAEECGSVTAASCSGLRFSRSGEDMIQRSGARKLKGHASGGMLCSESSIIGDTPMPLRARSTRGVIIRPALRPDSAMPHLPRINPAANSATTRAFVQWIRSAAPYIHAFRGKTFVIAFGGEVVADDTFLGIVHDLN